MVFPAPLVAGSMALRVDVSAINGDLCGADGAIRSGEGELFNVDLGFIGTDDQLWSTDPDFLKTSSRLLGADRGSIGTDGRQINADGGNGAVRASMYGRHAEKGKAPNLARGWNFLAGSAPWERLRSKPGLRK